MRGASGGRWGAKETESASGSSISEDESTGGEAPFSKTRDATGNVWKNPWQQWAARTLRAQFDAWYRSDPNLPTKGSPVTIEGVRWRRPSPRLSPLAWPLCGPSLTYPDYTL